MGVALGRSQSIGLGNSVSITGFKNMCAGLASVALYQTGEGRVKRTPNSIYPTAGVWAPKVLLVAIAVARLNPVHTCWAALQVLFCVYCVHLEPAASKVPRDSWLSRTHLPATAAEPAAEFEGR